MPELKTFPHCCTAKIMVDFGESATAEGGDYKKTPASMEASIKKKLHSIPKEMAMVVATTNDAQKTVNKILLNLGFEHSAWICKRGHANTRVRLWWLDMGKYRGDVAEIKKEHERVKCMYKKYNWRN